MTAEIKTDYVTSVISLIMAGGSDEKSHKETIRKGGDTGLDTQRNSKGGTQDQAKITQRKSHKEIILIAIILCCVCVYVCVLLNYY